MKTGNLYFDNSDRSLGEKVRGAIAQYRKSHGENPTQCWINPAMLDDHSPKEVDGVSVFVTNSVLPNHIWIGKGEQS